MQIPQLLHYTDDQTGWSRIKRGRGFSYLNHEGERISAVEDLGRIKDLTIPPAWKNVWICPYHNGYLQATGRDEKGRKQYIYHAAWMQYRQLKKFHHIGSFAQALPKLRKTTTKHLRKKEWSKKKVLALIVQILDECHVRIGNLQYSKRNKTYGLSTLRRKHLQLEDKKLQLRYRAKSGKDRKVTIANQRLVQLIKDCSELPGYEVFRYKTSKGKYKAVDSAMVNRYIRELSGGLFSCKDFRTWAGSVLAVELSYRLIGQTPEMLPEKLVRETVKRVASILGNTQSVCKTYYIHPSVLAFIQNGIKSLGNEIHSSLKSKFYSKLSKAEMLTLQIISSAPMALPPEKKFLSRKAVA